MSGNNEDSKKVGLQGTQTPNQLVSGLSYTTPVGLDKNIVGGVSTEYFIPHDAVLGLSQDIEPTWTAVHTFAEGANFRANITLSSGENPPAATLNVDSSSLKYKVATSATYEFYVGDALVGQIDDPAAPSGDNSLVSKSYVDQHGGNSPQPAQPKNPAVSIGGAVSDGSASTYMRSDVVLGLDQGIEPQWSSAHTFLDGVLFAPAGSPGQPNATLNLDGQSLRYTLTEKTGSHEFQVGATQLQLRDLSDVAEEDIPDDTLVGWGTIKQYVDGHVETGQLGMMVSYGAPLVDADNYPGWNPSNSVTIYGPSGMRYIVLADKQATLSEGDKTYSDGYLIFTMGDDGVQRLSVQMPTGVDNYGTSIRCGVHSPLDNTDPNILAVLQSLPPVEKSADFYPVIGVDPKLNFQVIESYAYARGVPSDGITPAQISVIVDATSNVTNLIMDVVDGDATFEGQATHCEPSITKTEGQEDGWVLVNVYSKSPGVSKIRITAPTVSDEVYAYPSFLLPIGTQSA